MSVLARDIDAYQRAVEAYNRQLRKHNKGVSQYNQTLVTDANGNPMLRDASGNVYAVGQDGRLSGGALPDGRTVADYGATNIEGDSRFLMLRQNPTTRNVEQVTGAVAVRDDNGNIIGYQVPNSEGVGQNLGPEYRVVDQRTTGGEIPQTTYTLERDASTYMDRPGAFEGKLRGTKPDPSMAQVRRMFNPGMAAQERGLVGQVIRSNGLATGGTPVQYRSGSVVRDPNQPIPPGGPTVIVEPDPNLNPPDYTIER